MRLKFEQLTSHCAKSLLPVYLVSGDEPLQAQEAADVLRKAARAQGFTERQVIEAGRGFDWALLAQEASSMSLFAERKLIDLRMPVKPGDPGSKALQAYCARPPEDTVLLIGCGKLDRGAVRSKWVQAVEAAGALVQVWPVEARNLGDWIQRRMRARGLQPTREAAAMLAERVEGNLLAAAQEIDKLILLHGEGRIGPDTVATAVSDSARFDVFGMVDVALAGNSARVARMLAGLHAEGVAPALVVWALGREIRALATIAADAQAGASLESVLTRHKIWDRRKPLVRDALKRHDASNWRALVLDCGRCERLAKGAAAGNAWDELLQLALRLSGTELFGERRQRASI